MKKTIIVIYLLVAIYRGYAQDFIPLWPQGKKPDANGVKITDSIFNERAYRVNTPGIYCFPATKAENTGSSILICPGGGYERVSYIYNGYNFARWFNTLGISVYVLLYRLPHQQDLKQRELAPLQDAQRALKIIRAHAAAWNIKPDKVGVMGISAGGHVASRLGTYVTDISSAKDSLDTISSRPDFMVLLSPVITMGEYAHPGSKRNFLGPDTSAAMIKEWSNEEQVSSQTPPSFIVHAINDRTVNVMNSLLFYEALVKKRINASIHIFPQGGHGIRLDNNPGSTDLWLELLEHCLKEMDFLQPLPFK